MSRTSPSDFSWHGRFQFLTTMAALLAVSVLTTVSSAQYPTSDLESIYPPGAKQGAEVEVTLGGKELESVSKLIFSHPGITAEPKTADDGFGMVRPVANQFTVNVAADVPPGIYEARVVSRYGVSNSRGFDVSLADEMMDDGSNKAFENAKPLPLNTVVNGRVDGSSRDYYKLTLKAGEQVLIDCRADRLDSRMDATLVLFDSKGKELVRSRDTVQRDPLIDFAAPADGDYIVGLYDFVYGGGGEYYYRLAAHSKPHVDFIFPPVGLAGTTGKYTVYGRNLPGSEPADGMTMGSSSLEKLTVDITLPSDEQAQRGLDFTAGAPLRLAALDGTKYQLQTSQGPANPRMIYFASAPVVLEGDSNDAPENAQQVTVPCEFVGQFYPSRDDDWIQFEAKQGQVFWIDAISHRMGLGTDPYLIVQRVTKDGAGKETVSDMAQVDDLAERNAKIGSDYDTTTDDPSYRFTANADANYRIMIRDQFSGPSDPRRVYRLVIREEQPDFRLFAVSEPNRVANANVVALSSPVVRRGGCTVVNVDVVRLDGFAGDVEVSVEGLPAGVTCAGAVIGSALTTAPLVIEAAEDAAAWVGPIRIVGKSKISDQDAMRVARAGSVVWGTANRTQIQPEFRLTDDLVLAVVDAEFDTATVKVGDGNMLETSLGGKLEIPIKVTRRNDFNTDLKLIGTAVSNELKPADVTIKGNETDGQLVINATNNNLKSGAYTFYLKGDAKFKYNKTEWQIQEAEEDQKTFNTIFEDLTAQAKAATDAKNAAAKAVTDAANAAKQAADKLKQAQDAANKTPDNKELADAVAAAQTAAQEADAANKQAAEAKTAADTASAEADAKLKAATPRKQQIDKRVTDLKNAKPADLTVSVFSSPIKVRIVDSPIKLMAQAPGDALKQGAKAEVPVTIERMYGFDEAVEVTLELPKGVAGLTINKVAVPKGQNAGKFEIAANDKATPGDHVVTIRAKAKFNNVNVETAEEITLKVEQVEPAK